MNSEVLGAGLRAQGSGLRAKEKADPGGSPPRRVPIAIEKGWVFMKEVKE